LSFGINQLLNGVTSELGYFSQFISCWRFFGNIAVFKLRLSLGKPRFRLSTGVSGVEAKEFYHIFPSFIKLLWLFLYHIQQLLPVDPHSGSIGF